MGYGFDAFFVGRGVNQPLHIIENRTIVGVYGRYDNTEVTVERVEDSCLYASHVYEIRLPTPDDDTQETAIFLNGNAARKVFAGLKEYFEPTDEGPEEVIESAEEIEEAQNPVDIDTESPSFWESYFSNERLGQRFNVSTRTGGLLKDLLFDGCGVVSAQFRDRFGSTYEPDYEDIKWVVRLRD